MKAESNCTTPCLPKCSARRRILVAGMGTSPVVLTNAVWALARQRVSVEIPHGRCGFWYNIACQGQNLGAHFQH